MVELIEVITDLFFVSQQLALSTFIEGGGPVFKSSFKAGASHRKSFLPCNIRDQLVMTSVVLISKGQPCPTSSGVYLGLPS